MTNSVLVVTSELLDLGAGAHRRVVFPDATHLIRDGVLHVASSIEGRGNLAAFAPGEWRSVVGGLEVETTAVTLETIGSADATLVTTAGVQ